MNTVNKTKILFRSITIGDRFLNPKIEETKKRIMNWLNEENYSPTEVADSNAYFNFSAKVGRLSCNVVQNIRKLDSFVVGVNFNFSSEQIELLQKMGKKRRQEFFWDLRLALIRNNELGEFAVKPNPPENVKVVFISSRPIFYDALSKDRLVSGIHLILRTVWMIVWMLERYAGSITPKETRIPFYV